MGGRTFFGSISHSICMFVNNKPVPMKIRPVRFSSTNHQILTRLNSGDYPSCYRPPEILSQVTGIKTHFPNFTQPAYPPTPRRYTSCTRIRHSLPDERFYVSIYECPDNQPAKNLKALWSRRPSCNLDSISYP
jgi:hypothetical protein